MPVRKLGGHQVEALTIAMIVAPGVYARNRMFDLFNCPGARRARMRASIVRGVVKHLARASSLTLVASDEAGTSFVLRYQIPMLHLSRVVELSPAELAALRLVAARANINALPPASGDRDIVASALAKLMDGDLSLEVTRLAQEISLAPSE